MSARISFLFQLKVFLLVKRTEYTTWGTSPIASWKIVILSADQRNSGLWRDQNALLMLEHYAIQSSIMSRGRPDLGRQWCFLGFFLSKLFRERRDVKSVDLIRYSLVHFVYPIQIIRRYSGDLVHCFVHHVKWMSALQTSIINKTKDQISWALSHDLCLLQLSTCWHMNTVTYADLIPTKKFMVVVIRWFQHYHA